LWRHHSACHRTRCRIGGDILLRQANTCKGNGKRLLRGSGTGSLVTVTIYHNPECGTSRNVLGLIRNTGDEPEIIEYLKTPPSRETLKDLIARMGMPVRDVLRQKGTLYEKLGLGNTKLSNELLLDAMMAHPILINRPIVVTTRGVKLCRPSETVLDILEAPQRGGFVKEDGERVIGPDGNRIPRPAP
jgi:arsenate reductase